MNIIASITYTPRINVPPKKRKKENFHTNKNKGFICNSNAFYVMLLRFLFNSPDHRIDNCIVRIITKTINRSFKYFFGSGANKLFIFGYYTNVAAFAVSFKCNNIALLHVFERNLFIHPSFQNIPWCWIGPFVSKDWRSIILTETNFTSLSIRIETISKEFFYFCCVKNIFCTVTQQYLQYYWVIVLLILLVF